MATPLSSVRCPECGAPFWKQQRLEDLLVFWGYRFLCFEGHVWEQHETMWIYDAFENHGVIDSREGASAGS